MQTVWEVLSGGIAGGIVLLGESPSKKARPFIPQNAADPVSLTAPFSIASDYENQCHSPSHSMQLLSLAAPHTYIGSSRQHSATPTCFVDQDYTNFDTHGTQTGYNYLDPNFYPAN